MGTIYSDHDCDVSRSSPKLENTMSIRQIKHHCHLRGSGLGRGVRSGAGASFVHDLS
jgi:hypothetical protein